MATILERNLALLRSRHPSLAERMAALPSTLGVQPSKAGPPTLGLPAENGAPVMIHSPEDPFAEAREGVPGGRPDAAIFVGAGLGYTLLEAGRRFHPKVWFGVVEPREDLFRAAMEHVDWSGILARDRIRFFVGLQGEELMTALRSWYDEAQLDEMTVLTHLPLERCAPSLYGRVGADLKESLNYRRTELVTLVKHGPILMTNGLRNLVWTARSAGVGALEGRFRGVPAIVIAAGPSLETQIDSLKRVQGKAVMVAVGKSLRLLLRHGIVPHFAVHLDLSSASIPVFEGLEIPAEVALVWDPESDPDTVAVFPGDRVTFETGLEISVWGRRFWGEKGALPRGLSVAHTAFTFARALGADPLVLVGVDLAFPGERTHAEGVTMTWGGSIDPLRGAMTEVPRVGGGTVATIPAFRAFLTLFESEIARTHARVVNTSRIGALIRGAEIASLDSLAGEARDPFPEIRRGLGETRVFRREDFREACDRLLRSAERVGEAAEAGLRVLRQVGRLDLRNRLDREKFSGHSRRVNRCRLEIGREVEIQPLIQRGMAAEALEAQRLQRRMDACPEGEKTRWDVERMRVFFEGYRKAARVFRDLFPAVRDALTG